MTTPTSGNNVGSVSLTTVSTTTTSTTFVVGETLYPYMRAKTITFIAEALKPNTQYYPFFNDIFVGAYCSQVSSPTIQSDGTIQESARTLKTDELGVLVGNYYLPANTFVSGSYIFKLVDNIRVSGGATIADPIYSSTETTYEANGVLKQLQTQITQDVNVNTPPPPTPPTPPTPNVDPPKPKICERWTATYAVSSSAEYDHTVTTGSRTPPNTIDLDGHGVGKISSPGTTSLSLITQSPTFRIRHISSAPNDRDKSKYDHKFHVTRTSVVGSDGIYDISWIGPKVTNPLTDLPSLVDFRPSGLSSNQTVNIISVWRKTLDSIVCPVKAGLTDAIRRPNERRSDPLAQSFFVDPDQYPDGIFVTSIGVYFRTADQSTPAILELRNMVNGLPGSNVMPGGIAILPGYAVASSVDATVPTIFRFDFPIYLRPSTDYCFVLKSTSMGYNTWCSRMGEIDVTTGKVIDNQPFGGTLFKSENDVTWIPDSYEDIKFDLYKANFDISVTGNLIFKPQKNTAGTQYVSTSQILPLSFISTTKGSGVVNIQIPMHCLQDDDKITIDGIATPIPADKYNGILVTNLNKEHTITVIDEDNISITITGNNATKTGNLYINDIYGLINNIPSVMPAELPIQSAIPNVESGNLSPSTVQSGTYNIQQPTPPTITSPNTFTVYTNIPVNEVAIDYMGTELNNTLITELIKLATGTSTAGSETPYTDQDYIEVEHRDDYYSFNSPRIISTPSNESLHNLTIGDSSKVNIKLQSSNKDISPVVDVNGISLNVRSFKIDNQSNEIGALITQSDFNDPTQNSEITPGSGKASAKYKGKINILSDLNNKISLFVTGNCPSPAKIDAYIRTSTDKDTHGDRNWTWIPINGKFGTAFANSSNDRLINEWFFEHTFDEPFTVFDVKLVMRSTNNSVVPKIHSVRTITSRI